MTSVTVTLLGAPRVERDGAPVAFDTRKATALLAYLAVTGRPHTREALTTLLWPDQDPEHGRGALRRTLSTLRRGLGEEHLEVAQDRVSIAAAPRPLVDVAAFRASAQRGRDGDGAALADAARLYSGDLLDGFFLRDSHAFDDWQTYEAEALRSELADVLDRLVDHLGREGDPTAALAHARRRLALDPLHEPAHRALIRLHAWAGDRPAALRAYRDCLRLLSRDLGVRPVEETVALYRAVKEDRVPGPPAPAAGASGPTAGPPAPRARAAPGEPPVVGRAAELLALRRAWLQAGAGGRLMVVEGEGGVGKTRLAEEFLARAIREGASALTARWYEGEAGLVLGPVAEAVRAGLVARPDLTLDPAIRAEAARLVPELGDGDKPEGLERASAPGAQSRFLGAVLELVLALVGGPRPGVLLLDDLHWADDASLELLTFLVRRTVDRPLLVLGTWRGEEVDPGHRLRRLLAEATRAGTGEILRLGRLDRDAVEELVRAAPGVGPELTDRLWAETEGLPFYVRAYLEAAASGAVPPPLLGADELLRSRLADVGELATQLLAAAAAIGHSSDADLLREASGRGEEETVTGLEELVARGLLQETPTDQGPAIAFSHEKIRALVLERTGLARRRLLHRRAGQALARRWEGRAGADAQAATIAHHLRLGGDDAAAASQLERAGEHARALFANAEALEHLRGALALGGADPARLHEAIGDVETLTGDYAGAAHSYETAAASREHPPRALARLEHKLGELHARAGDGELAAAHLDTAADLLAGEDDPALLARVRADRSLAALRAGDEGTAERLSRDALETADAAGDPLALAQATNLLGVLAKAQGDLAEAERQLERSLALAEAAGDRGARVAALNNLALARRAAGRGDEALAAARAALELCAAQGDRHREAALHNNLADLLHGLGRGEEAMDHLKRAVTLFAEVGEESVAQPEIWKLVDW